MKRAFTLVELLVVTAILAVLAAVLLPVFAQAKAEAQKRACFDNVRKLGAAMNLYLGDSQDAYPNTQTTSLWIGRHIRWPLMPYLGTQAATGGRDGNPLACPSDPGRDNFEGASYFYSSAFFRATEELEQLTVLDLITPRTCSTCVTHTKSEVIEPSKKILFSEWLNAHAYASQPTGPWGKTDFLTGWIPGPERWSGSRNHCFADGHAMYLTARRQFPSHLDTPDANLTPGGVTGIDIRKP
jgi:prepilin-type N-terminal cleavage/methylation domain-containing protein